MRPRIPAGHLHSGATGPAMIASTGGVCRLAPVLRGAGWIVPFALLLASCAPAGPDRAASEVLEKVLEQHRASIAALDTTPRPPPRAATHRLAPGSVAALLGQTQEAVLAALGPPARRRPEGQAEIWLYQGPRCALDLILYRDRATARVAWAAARASGTERETEAGCLTELGAG
jgi:hypothetical protein